MKLLGNLRKSKVYRLFLLSHVIVLLFPLFASPIMIAGARKTVAAQLSSANDTTLRLAGGSIDSMLKDVYAASSLLIMHQNTLTLKNKLDFHETVTDDVVDLKTRLVQNILQSASITDIFMYFNRSGNTLCRQGIYHRADLSATVSESLHISYADWAQWLVFEGRRSHRLYDYVSRTGDTETMLLLYHKSSRVMTAGSAVVTVCALNIDLLRETLGRFGGDAYARLYMVDDAGRAISAVAGESVSAEELSGDKVLCVPSAYEGWHYCLVPVDRVDAALRTMLPYIVGYYLICFLIGIVLIVFLSRMHYTPLQRMAESFLGSMTPTGAGDEYELINATVKKTLERLRDSDSTIAEYRNAGQDAMLWHLLMGRVTRDTRSQMQRFGLSFPSERFAVLMYSVENISLRLGAVDDERLSLDVIDFIVADVAQKEASDGCRRYALALDEGIACVVGLTPDAGEAQALEALYTEAVRSVGGFTESLNLTVYAAISGVENGLEGVHRAYRCACELLGHEELMDAHHGVLRSADMPEADAQEKDAVSDRDRGVIEYLKANYQNDTLNLTALAQVFELTPSYLSQIIRRQTGMTALDYLHALRIAHAKRLLSDTALSIKDVAQTVGYGNSLNMIRAFHRYEGVTPNEYCQQQNAVSV